MEEKEIAQAIRIDRTLIELHPEFAETHFRLARLLEKTGQWGEAREHYVQAREHDAMPMRCPEPLRQVIRDVAARYRRCSDRWAQGARGEEPARHPCREPVS